MEGDGVERRRRRAPSDHGRGEAWTEGGREEGRAGGWTEGGRWHLRIVLVRKKTSTMRRCGSQSYTYRVLLAVRRHFIMRNLGVEAPGAIGLFDQAFVPSPPRHAYNVFFEQVMVQVSDLLFVFPTNGIDFRPDRFHNPKTRRARGRGDERHLSFSPPRYCEEEVEVNDGVIFRTELDPELDTPLLMEIELLYCDVTQLGGADAVLDGKFEQDQITFKSASRRKFVLHSLANGSCHE